MLDATILGRPSAECGSVLYLASQQEHGWRNPVPTRHSISDQPGGDKA